MGKTFKILTIDGGGIKGLYSAQVLSRFEEIFRTNISDHFDLICGTSTGGIIALAASAKKSMSTVVSLYDNDGPKIFTQWFKYRLPICGINLGNFLLKMKQSVFSSKYNGKYLEKALKREFKDMTLAENNNLLCIPSYNITTATPRVFKKDYGSLTEDSKKTYYEVALATAAAPTYLPVRTINDNEYIDGGLWANDPMMVGLTEFIFKILKPKDERTNNDYDKVEILSISSCEKNGGEAPKCKSRSFLGWANTLFDIYSNGQSFSNRMFLEKIKPFLDFELNITRVVNKPLSAEQASYIDMDNASKKSRQLLRGIGKETAANYKDNEKIKMFFTETKTYTI